METKFNEFFCVLRVYNNDNDLIFHDEFEVPSNYSEKEIKKLFKNVATLCWEGVDNDPNVFFSSSYKFDFRIYELCTVANSELVVKPELYYEKEQELKDKRS